MVYYDKNCKFDEIYTGLCCMGAAINGIGTFQTAYAIYLVRCQPKDMKFATKQLYPAIAKYCGTNWMAVERNIRYTITSIWKHNLWLANTIQRPKTMQFIMAAARIRLRSDAYMQQEEEEKMDFER
ncbi:MAG: sporulation initiation factor Spo0A C-terminal domain-containing protein [Clostridia bacterium]|nr:sporulation initiation factor Spo0A C-terminal domain-containing protein [Clostridia bacterium]